MARTRGRAEMERAATICAAIHNAHCTDNAHCIQVEDLCPWMPKRRQKPDTQMTMSELGAALNRKFPS